MRLAAVALAIACVQLGSPPARAQGLDLTVALVAPASLAEPATFDVAIALPEGSEGGRLPVGTLRPRDARDATMPERELRLYERTRRVLPPLFDLELPPPTIGPDGRRSCRVAFRQPLEPAYGWGTILGRVRWVQALPLPGSLAVEVRGGLQGAGMAGWRCEGAAGSRSCARTSDRPFAVVVPIAQRSEALGLAALAGIGLVLGVAATLVARRTAGLHRSLFGDVSDPRDVRAGYRDPAVVPDEGAPTMPPALGARLRRRAMVAALAALVPICATAVMLDGRSEMPMPSLLSLLAVIGGVSSLIFLSSAHGRWATLATTAFAAAGIGVFGLPGVLAGLAPALVDVMFRSTARVGV